MNKLQKLKSLVESSLENFIDSLPMTTKPTSISSIKSSSMDMSQDAYKDLVHKAKGMAGVGNWLNGGGFDDSRFWIIDAKEGMYLIDTQGYEYPRYAIKATGKFADQLEKMFDELDT